MDLLLYASLAAGVLVGRLLGNRAGRAAGALVGPSLYVLVFLVGASGGAGVASAGVGAGLVGDLALLTILPVLASLAAGLVVVRLLWR